VTDEHTEIDHARSGQLRSRPSYGSAIRRQQQGGSVSCSLILPRLRPRAASRSRPAAAVGRCWDAPSHRHWRVTPLSSLTIAFVLPPMSWARSPRRRPVPTPKVSSGTAGPGAARGRPQAGKCDCYRESFGSRLRPRSGLDSSGRRLQGDVPRRL
jgi:hypothetical protein